MAFNSLTFLAFFAIVFALYQLPLGWTAKKLILLIASLLFYAAWNPPFVLLLMFSATMDFCLARWMGRTESLRGRRALLVVSLTLNLSLLAYFKYGAFLLENFIILMASLGINYRPAPPSIILPLGISFYTFETISYLIDVYRKEVSPWDSFLDYALFLTFFPHLVAGPIVRGGDFLPQCRTPRRASAEQIGWGLSLVVFGLFEKMLLADTILQPVVDKVYGASTSHWGFADAWLGTLAFAGQILFDFAGYSTCAIGLALSLGFVLNDNFHCPYAAIGFSDFWQRWHISLSSWLRDYLYIPLGGNRKGPARTYANLMITMLLGGLWHGASWRFVAWGGLHGLFLVVERLVRRGRGAAGEPRGFSRFPLMLLTFGLVCLTWVFFRAADFEAACRMVSAMLLGWGGAAGPVLVSRGEAVGVLLVTGTLLACHWALRDSSLEASAARLPWPARGLGLGFMSLCLFYLIMRTGENRAFIYFQF